MIDIDVAVLTTAFDSVTLFPFLLHPDLTSDRRNKLSLYLSALFALIQRALVKS